MGSPRLQIVFAAALLSTGGAAIKSCALTGWQVASFRSGLAACTLFLVFPAWRRLWEPRTLLVACSYAATMTLFVISNKLTTAANAIFLQATAPLYLLVLGPWILHERVGRGELILTLVIGLGMVMFFLGAQPPLETAPDPFLGNILAACLGVLWGTTLLGLRWLGRETRRAASVGRAVVAGNFITCLFCLPMAFPLGAVTATDLAIVGYLGLFQIALAYTVMTFGVRHVPALEASLLLLLEPVLSAMWAWALHGEAPGPWSGAGCITIFVASVLRAVAAGRSSSG
ncbi:MAG: DMT family transporter [Proteobacteria bacterium]|nr:DMT family transporter [Pseudomonadota bacterium]